MLNNSNDSSIIRIHKCYGDSWGERLQLSDVSDLKPNEITILFDKNWIDLASQVFESFPMLLSINLAANISCKDIGYLLNSRVTFNSSNKTIYARFTNGYTGTVYELDITSDIAQDSEPLIPSQKKYLEHTLHGQIESEAFWREQLASWDTDCAGNTPEQQFDLILEESSQFYYLMQEIEHGAEGMRVFHMEQGAGRIMQVHKDCPVAIVVDVKFDNGEEMSDIPVAEISNWIFL